MAQGKVHRKLKILNDFLRKDLMLAHQNEQESTKVVELATAQVGIALHNVKKAQRMYRLINSVKNFYQQSRVEYSMKVAMFVSRHRVLNQHDYLTLRSAISSLPQNLGMAQSQLTKYIRHPLNPFVF